MSRSELFYSDRYKTCEKDIQAFLNAQKGYLSAATVQSTRAVGDAIQGILGEKFCEIVGDDVCAKSSAQFARRAMADLVFEDDQKFYYLVDVKTHRLDTKFNMPNLTSVERLARFYEDDHNYFVVLMVAYNIVGLNAVVQDVKFMPVEFFGWDCLTIGALGWGQLQIADSNRITVNPRYSRRTWMLELCDSLFEFYPREIEKATQRIGHFKRVKERWEKRPE